MAYVFKNDIVGLEQYSLNNDDDIFECIIKVRSDDIDYKRFFLEYLPEENFKQYNFDVSASLEKFKNDCMSIYSPLRKMGGYNMDSRYLNDDIRYAGLKMSDPCGEIYGSFDIRNGVITYSPLFPRFYEERDLIKFATDTYFTTMTFKDIMLQQIDKASSFFVHVGNYESFKDVLKNGKYVLEKVNKDRMIEFVSNPEEGIKVYHKFLGY